MGIRYAGEMAAERIEITGASGAQLAARLDTPDTGEIRAYAVFAHCFTCGKDIAAATRLARGLTGRGFAVLRFDFTGIGHSEGEFASTSFSSNVDDLVAVADWLGAERSAPKLLVGHSLGGAAVLAAASRVASCRAVATIGAPCDPAHVEHLLGGAVDALAGAERVEVTLAGRPFTISRGFLEDIRDQAQRERIASLHRALLVMHSPLDSYVGIDNAARIFEAAKHPKSFVSLDDADHLLTRAEDAAYAAEVLAAWAGRYV